MLGRYIAGTLLILGVAMMVAPDATERPDTKDVPVARAESSPVTLASVGSKKLAEAAQLTGFAQPAAAQDKAAELAPTSLTPAASGQKIQAGVEAALLQALALDETEERQLEAIDAENAFAGLELAMAVTDAPEPALADRAPRFMFVTGTSVNVRSGPSTQYRVVGTVSSGAPVELISYEGESWARIRFEDGETTGYMSRKFLTSEAGNG